MWQRIAVVYSVLLVCVFAAGVASAAKIPPLYHITVIPADAINGVIAAPSASEPIPSSIEHITIRNEANQPMPNVTVHLELGTGTMTCPGQSFNGVTDSEGRVDITVSGGGCISNRDDACMIWANGVMIRNYRNAKSPDFDGARGDGVVGLADLVELWREKTGGGSCHDYDNDGDIDLSDIVVFSTAFSPGHRCP